MLVFFNKQKEGNRMDENFTGEAKVKYKNGEKFIGTFINGYKRKGKYFYSNKSIYDGFFMNEKRCGYGKLIKKGKQKSMYIGNFENGKKKGIGFQRYQNGDFYYGEWENNKKNGKGIYYFYSTKEYYCGEWNKGNFNNGSWVISEDVQYVGTYFKNKPKFKGNFLFSNNMKVNVFFHQFVNLSNMNEEEIQLIWKNV
ncbi:hypothetical protein PRSY57_0204300 [Plasmodium reichenowi]|uniref:MORN repeat protein n=1 Tax=Plasmodium reichenowi TaxID=5854 RepID=A0A151LUX8_PLARE|nr:hypothetical protein PRSY57_0204300 [Plasmodium reichenowi]KYO02971.1 hypothetical protein PRSY57_0204300 [Plasmodium reichenowi]